MFNFLQFMIIVTTVHELSLLLGEIWMYDLQLSYYFYILPNNKTIQQFNHSTIQCPPLGEIHISFCLLLTLSQSPF